MGGLHCDAISTRKRMRSWDGLATARVAQGELPVTIAGVKGVKQSDDFTKCQAKLDDFARDDALGGPLKLRLAITPPMPRYAWNCGRGHCVMASKRKVWPG